MSESQIRQRLAAILAADAAGYSKRMAEDERGTVAALDAARAIFHKQVAANQGRVVDMAGDSVLAVFEIATGAVAAALAIQQELAAGLSFRIGIHLGEIIEKPDGTVYGDGVNVAARLQALVEPGGVAVSDAVRVAVGKRVATGFADRGEQALKNIPYPLRWHCACALQPDAAAESSRAHSVVRRSDADMAALPSLAIIPFHMAAQDHEHACFADGLRTDIQWALAKIAGLMLIGFGTTNAYRDKSINPQQAAAAMGVRYLLEGFVQKSGERARITVSLVSGASGQVVWTEHYDRVLTDALEVQDEIAERVVTALDVKLLSGEYARVWRKNLRNARARECFYRGNHEFMKGQKDANAMARGLFEEVARLAPQSSIGPALVAFSHWWDAFRGWTGTPARSLEQAAQWADRAMPMEDADGQAHTVMAHIHLLRREHDQALQRAQEAVTLRPSCSNANPHLGNILYYCGRPEAAADRMRQAMRLAPVHAPWFNVVLAASCKELGQWDAAGAAAKEALRMKPDEVEAYLVQIEVCRATGKESEARQLAQQVMALKPDFSVSRWAALQPFRDSAVLERISTSLCEAGLPS